MVTELFLLMFDEFIHVFDACLIDEQAK